MDVEYQVQRCLQGTVESIHHLEGSPTFRQPEETQNQETDVEIFQQSTGEGF